MKIVFRQTGTAGFGAPFRAVKNKSEVKEGMIKIAAGEDVYVVKPQTAFLNPKLNPGGSKLASIMDKISAGKNLFETGATGLSAFEMQKSLFLKEERDYYKKLLKQCRSKDEVKELKQQKTMEFLMQIDAVDRSSMDAGAKARAKDFIKERIEGITEEHEDFIRTAEYGMLPKKSKESEQERLMRRALAMREQQGRAKVNAPEKKDAVAEAAADIASKRAAGEFTEVDFEFEAADSSAAVNDYAPSAAAFAVPAGNPVQKPDAAGSFDLKV